MILKNVMLIIFGIILLSLGTVGIFLPLLPTTPFVIGAAACFSCAPKLRAHIMRIPVFSKYIENYKYRAGLPKKTVVFSLVFLWASLLISCILVASAWITLLLSVIGVCVTIHIIMVSRLKKPEHKQNKNK